VHAEFI